MRYFVLLLLVLCAGCATDPDVPVRSACADMSCFYERQIRDVQFLGTKTLIAFVGPQRCAYRMELTGSFCDVGVGPYVNFDNPGKRGSNSGDARICIYDRPYIYDPMLGGRGEDSSDGLRGGPVSGLPAPETYRNRGVGADHNDQCRVLQITPLTDDELLEVYTEKGVQSPLPPVGSGEVTVGDQTEGEGATAPEGEPAQAGTGAAAQASSEAKPQTGSGTPEN
jgi:hypothetical protein